MRDYRDELYPSTELEIYEPNIIKFFKFMYARHNIWHRRFVKHLPRKKWTKNKILKVYKYTNIYRQLDRGTLWTNEVILKPFNEICRKHNVNFIVDDTDNIRSNHNVMNAFKDVIFKDAQYKLCNRIETFEKVGLCGYNDFNPVYLLRGFYNVSKNHHAPMTNAHLTCQCPKGSTKSDSFVASMIEFWFNMDDIVDKMITGSTEFDFDLIFKSIHQNNGFGGFIAYEVYCDLALSPYTAFNTNDFVNVGPGASEAIKLLYPSTKGVKAVKDRLYELHQDQDKWFKRADCKFKYNNWLEPIEDQLSVRSIEHSLCEFSKYFLQCHQVGKRRLEYDRWSSHPDCSINPDGMSLSFNKETYDKFYLLSNEGIKSKMWKQFRKYFRKSKPSKDDIYKFITKIKKRYKL